MLHIPASRAASCLGLSGLIPFIVLASCLWLVAPAWQPQFAHALAAWGAVVLTFIGAVHWGAALYDGDAPHNIWRYVYGICPGFLGWAALMAPADRALFVLFAGLVAAFVVDRRVFARHEWYVTLRAVLTIVASGCLFAGYKAL